MVALRHVTRLLDSYPELPFEGPPTPNLDLREAALAHAIVGAVVRRWITLSAVVQSRMDRPLADADPFVRAALLAGAAQMLFLDRIPPHAALFETVAWIKKRERPQAAGFVNGVLRSISRMIYPEDRSDPRALPAKTRRAVWTNAVDEIPDEAGGAIVLQSASLPQDPIERMAVATGHSLDLVRRFVDDFGPNAAMELVRHNLNASPPTVLNTAHLSGPLPPNCVAHAQTGSHVYEGPHPALAGLLKERTDLWVQDASSSLAVSSVSTMRPGLIVDLCAGQGTKTRQLAATFPHAQIIASDPDVVRSHALREAVAHLSHVKVMAPGEAKAAARGKADLVLADVPCTNTGVLARRAEARHRCDETQLTRLVAIQRQIMRESIPLLAAKGILLYATCSVERAENEQQAAWAVSLGAVLRSERRTMPSGIVAPTEYHDGAYSAVLQLK